MKQTLLPALCIALLSISLAAAANPVILIENQSAIDRLNNSIVTPQNNGDQLLLNVLTTSTAGWEDIRRTFLTWDNSLVDCNKLNYSETTVNWLCMLTVTPSMNHSTDVNVTVKTGNIVDGFNYTSLFVGTFAFNGTPYPLFPPNPFVPTVGNCSKVVSCVAYVQSCIPEIVGSKVIRQRSCTEIPFNITKKERICIEIPYTINITKTVCNRINNTRHCEQIVTQLQKIRKQCHYELINETHSKKHCVSELVQVPVEKMVCTDTQTCLTYREKNVCTTN
ncbi:hypothetical protein M0R04_09815 [Candidatus Dojkabacteria bacterium]|jgi:hypothetical protein|nr:hypothetical protein [Candidatus Dojkabacteria bacterium]